MKISDDGAEHFPPAIEAHEPLTTPPPVGKMNDVMLANYLRSAATRPEMYFGMDLPDELRELLRAAGERLMRYARPSKVEGDRAQALQSLGADLFAHPDDSILLAILRAALRWGAFASTWIDEGARERLLDEAAGWEDFYLHKALRDDAKQ